MSRHLLFGLSSFLMLALFGFAAYRQETPEWKGYQRGYYEKLAQKVGDPKAAGTPLRLKQIWNDKLDRADRCITCHAAIDNPVFERERQPYRVHPKLSGYIGKHPFEKFGCTICHEGDPQAIRVEQTHGVVEHLDRQMLSGPYVQASCTKCHYELYSPDVYWKETPQLMAGKRLAAELGCAACHAIKQIGATGNLAPDLSALGSKTELAFFLVHDYTSVSGPKITRNWEWQHFKDPQKIVPGNLSAPDPRDRTSPTIMPDWGLSDEEATALTVFVLSLRDPKVERIPRSYLPAPKFHEEFLQYRQ